MEKKTLVTIIKGLCDSKGISIAELERNLGLGNSTIRKWDTNKPNVEKLQKVADYFHVTTDYLLGREQTNDELLFLRGGDKLNAEEREELKKILQMSADVYLRAKGLIK